MPAHGSYPICGRPPHERAIELAGILFMEGEGEPGEITRIKRELESAAQGNDEAGGWLASAMEASWAVAEGLLGFPAWRATWIEPEPHSTISTSRQQRSERTLRRIAAIRRFSTRPAN